MSKENPETAIGVVTEALPNTEFRVLYEEGPLEGEEKIAYLAGKMKKYRIRVLVGDKVKVELDSYGGKGRIVLRL